MIQLQFFQQLQFKGNTVFIFNLTSSSDVHELLFAGTLSAVHPEPATVTSPFLLGSQADIVFVSSPNLEKNEFCSIVKYADNCVIR